MWSQFGTRIDREFKSTTINQFDLPDHQRNETNEPRSVSGTPYFRHAPARKKNTILDLSRAKRS